MVSQTGLLKRTVWYQCSCGKSGSHWKGRNQVMAEHRRHVERESTIDRDCRLRDAAPAVLAALVGLGSKCRQCRKWHRLGCEHLFTIKHPDPMPVCDEACAAARAAIAQSEAGE